ncbi:PEP/pyruvate-binding domain-containing protein [Streptosporangium canum]|uniref:PEP/pyruvate-binding domain-containing protein n=1 Tax=Streptosporangium canum TaxID=324952 RepID=UPI0037AB425A
MTSPDSCRVLIPLARADDVATCGGKATALARLIAAGLPVPDGVVVPVAFPCDRLEEIITPILTWAASRAPYGLIARSSAYGEDGAYTSFAGLYASVFTPAEPAALLEAITQVRESVHASAAHHYAHVLSADSSAAMAVLIQPALRPHASGVLAAELDGKGKARWRIEAVRGLAEPLVSGRQTGEIHTSDSHGGRTFTPCDQEVILLPGSAAELSLPPGEWTTVEDTDAAGVRAKVHTSGYGIIHLYRPAYWVNQSVLNGDQAHDLVTLATAAAIALGLKRIDIEWALTSDRTLHLVQARPLTAPLPPIPHGPAAPSANGIWQGIPAVSGIGTGPAVHLTEANAGDLSPDDVADSVIICGPLGPEAVQALCYGPSAIVATAGGPLSHTAIVARELGIPCITAVTSALTTIPPGAWVSVDGAMGTVTQTTDSSTPAGAPIVDLHDSAVLTRILPAETPADGRAATVLLYDPASPGATHDFEQFITAARTRQSVPLGLLQPAPQPPLTVAPPGYRAIFHPGLGGLVWPAHVINLPTQIVALSPEGSILFCRAVDQ